MVWKRVGTDERKDGVTEVTRRNLVCCLIQMDLYQNEFIFQNVLDHGDESRLSKVNTPSRQRKRKQIQ